MDFPWGTLNDSAGKMHYPPCKVLFPTDVYSALINLQTVSTLDTGSESTWVAKMQPQLYSWPML